MMMMLMMMMLMMMMQNDTKNKTTHYLAEIHNHFLNKWSHWGDVNDFELVNIDSTIHINMLTDFIKDGQ